MQAQKSITRREVSQARRRREHLTDQEFDLTRQINAMRKERRVLLNERNSLSYALSVTRLRRGQQ